MQPPLIETTLHADRDAAARALFAAEQLATLIARVARVGDHWNNAACSLLTGLIIRATDLRASAAYLHSVLSASDAELEALGIELSASPDPAVAEAGTRFLSRSSAERAGVIATAKQQLLAWLSTPAMRECGITP